MPVLPIKESAKGIDLSGRVASSAAVVASPAAAAETIVATVTIPDDVALALGVLVLGYAAFTVGANGVSANLRIRQTDASGTIVKASGAMSETAANLDARSIVGLDAAAGVGQKYVLTLTVGSASAGSAVSAVALVALAI